MNKILIHNRFAKNLKSYNENAKIQKKMAEKLSSFIQDKTVGSILEIGCGTGFLTNIVSTQVEFKSYTAIDIVEECKDYITPINNNIEFIQCDIEDFLEINHNKFDLIISNASLQWVENFEGVVNSLKDRLNPNGKLIFSTFGQENFREIYNTMGTTLHYYSIQELQDMFPDGTIETEIHIMAFKDPKSVLKHLQLTGVNAIESRTWTKKDLMRFENAYKTICCTRPTLTYNPVFIKITV